MRRRLEIIPIVHDAADLGSMSEAVRAQIGEAAWSAQLTAVGEFWDSVESWAAGIEAHGLRVYQDGLPVDAPVEPLVREVASRGSRNHGLLLGLMARGAEVVGTEDADLLRREVELARAAADAARAGRLADPRHASRARALLERRDRFIADRIDGTLGDGGRGLLLIGAFHNVERFLPDEMERGYPLGRPGAAAAG